MGQVSTLDMQMNTGTPGHVGVVPELAGVRKAGLTAKAKSNLNLGPKCQPNSPNGNEAPKETGGSK